MCAPWGASHAQCDARPPKETYLTAIRCLLNGACQVCVDPTDAVQRELASEPELLWGQRAQACVGHGIKELYNAIRVVFLSPFGSLTVMTP